MSHTTMYQKRHRTEVHNDADRLVAVRSIVRMGEDGDLHATVDALRALGVSPAELSSAQRSFDDEALDWPW